MLKITQHITLNDNDIHLSFIRSPGPGGQNVNKVATAALLRFNIERSTLPDEIKWRLTMLVKSKLSSQGDLIIKASRFRTQERNKQDALERLRNIIVRAAHAPKKRKKTFLPFAKKQTRLATKKRRGDIKTLRSKSDLARE